ncbi:MAG TPA: hypothetical protein VN238_01650 [Solirubrobacteraceae bacterium]|nr:hypothetical protein [Solirubrobacteraceae bacterium]
MIDGDGYVAAAYIIFLALVLIYVGIMAFRLSNLERELAELNQEAAQQDAEREAPEPAKVG